MQSATVAVGRPVGFTEGSEELPQDLLVEDVVLSAQLLQKVEAVWKDRTTRVYSPHSL